MMLFLKTGRGGPTWEGYDYVVNHTVKDGSRTLLERSTGGWSWQRVAEIPHDGQGILVVRDKPPVIFSAKWLRPTVRRSSERLPVKRGTSCTRAF